MDRVVVVVVLVLVVLMIASVIESARGDGCRGSGDGLQ